MSAPERMFVRAKPNGAMGRWHDATSDAEIAGMTSGGLNPMHGYILATPEALANSPEVQALIAAAETRGMDRAAEIAESIRTRITNGPMPEGARFDYEQAIRAEADAIRALKKGE